VASSEDEIGSSIEIKITYQEVTIWRQNPGLSFALQNPSVRATMKTGIIQRPSWWYSTYYIIYKSTTKYE
jgi:hypothetical protein